MLPKSVKRDSTRSLFIDILKKGYQKPDVVGNKEKMFVCSFLALKQN